MPCFHLSKWITPSKFKDSRKKQAKQATTSKIDVTKSHRASKAVFGINELLEHVLSHLPMKDLVHAQQVCQHWRTTIAGSLLLRQHLFLEPAVLTIEWIDLTRSPLSPEVRLIAGSDWNLIKDSGVGQLNPLLGNVFYSRIPGRVWRYELLYEDLRRILSWREGTWEAKLISQPPAQRVQIETNHNGWFPSIEINDPEGLRLGALEIALRASVEKTGAYEEWRRWGRKWRKVHTVVSIRVR